MTPRGRLGVYELLAPLGAGGMGEVWRALDTRLGREVALKLLPDSVAHDEGRLSRFEREAKLLASVNHPGIATLYAIEHLDGRPVMVMEVVEGPTLADRIGQGALRWKEAVGIAGHIAEALEAAHEKGVIHRDLKPSNIKLSTDTHVKLLDFGLGKDLRAKSVDSEAGLSTDTSPTDAGAILGTAPYMSPEQARGEAVDERTDIWAFGCVLYEMLTGGRAFRGRTPSDLIAAVLEHEPGWAALPPDTPPLVVSVLRRCLSKDPFRRLRAIADARIELDEALTMPLERPAVRSPGSHRWLWTGATVALMVASAAAAWMSARGARGVRREPMRFNLVPSPGTELSRSQGQPVIALSRDGRQLLYAAEKGGIYIRSLEGVEAHLVPGTERGTYPFFSPDGRSVAFVSGGKLCKVSVNGGAPRPIADAPDMRGASWSEDGEIVFAPDPIGGLFQVSAEGGTPKKLTEPRTDVEHSHRWPQVLPGGASVLFTIWPPNLRVQDARIAILSVKTGQQKVIVEGGTHARYVPTGHLVYGSLGTVFAAPFDVDRLELTGPAVPVVEDVRMAAHAPAFQARTWTLTGIAQFGFSATGVLAYVTPRERPTNTQLLWIDRGGSAAGVVSSGRRPFSNPTLSPDGRRLVVSIDEADGGTNLWLHDRDRQTWRQLTFEKNNELPIWSPAGDLLAFGSNRNGLANLFVMPSDGGVPRHLIPSTNTTQYASGWSPDGRTVLFRVQNRGFLWDVWEVALDETSPKPLLVAPGYQGGARLSPDGRWLAYVSSESGQAEVFVRPYRGQDLKWTISTEGGYAPMWTRDGRELLYVSGRSGSYRVVAVPVTTTPAFRPGAPRLLFERRGEEYGLDVTPDGQHFVVAEDSEAVPERLEIVVVPDWFDELKAKVPVPK